MTERIEGQGYIVAEKAITLSAVVELLSALRQLRPVVTRSRGIRNLATRVPRVAELAASPEIRGLAESVLGDRATLVRSILFDKVEGANWAIRWHQDRTIAVVERREVEGYGPWSIKEGVVSVQPPAHVLERMISIRVHLDDCGEGDGALRVIPGSHRSGKLSPEVQDRWVKERTPVVCVTNARGVVVMRPLLLHSSLPADSPSHRRVVHLDYAACELDGGLQWNHQA